MKAALHVFRVHDHGLVLVKNHPDIEWSVSRTHEELVANAGEADILVLNNRACTP